MLDEIKAMSAFNEVEDKVEAELKCLGLVAKGVMVVMVLIVVMVVMVVMVVSKLRFLINWLYPV